MNNFSKELGPYRFQTHEEALKSLREYLPDPMGVIFLRPHHLYNWFLLHFYGYDTSGNTYDPYKFARWLKKGCLSAVQSDVDQLLLGQIPPRMAGQQVEYLKVLRDADSDILSDRDMRSLAELRVTEDDFNELAIKEAEMFSNIWSMPDTATIVAARVFDHHCYMLSPKGCTHCNVPIGADQNLDESYLWALVELKKSPELTPDQRDQIQIKYADESGVIQAVIFPISFLKDARVIYEIQHLVANRR